MRQQRKKLQLLQKCEQSAKLSRKLRRKRSEDLQNKKRSWQKKKRRQRSVRVRRRRIRRQRREGIRKTRKKAEQKDLQLMHTRNASQRLALSAWLLERKRTR